jgi:hypothetical protein
MAKEKKGTKVYDKDGKVFIVVHKIDVKGWLDTGYSLDDPKAKKASK